MPVIALSLVRLAWKCLLKFPSLPTESRLFYKHSGV